MILTQPAIQPRSSWYLARLLEPERRAGCIYLPEQSVSNTTDALVEAAGPGRLNERGERISQQAKVGDRVVTQDYNWKPLDRFSDVRMVRDEDLVAVIPGPEHTEILAANEYVMIAPDPLPRERQLDSGIIVATNTLRGEESRFRQRGEELWQQFQALGRREEFGPATGDARVMTHARWERQRLYKRELDALSPYDRGAIRFVWDCLESSGEAKTDWEYYLPPSSAERPTSGVVLDYGPEVARVLPKLPCGSRVHWDKSYQGVELWDGERLILMLPAKYLAAVETDDE